MSEPTLREAEVRDTFADVELIEQMKLLGFTLTHHEGVADWFHRDEGTSELTVYAAQELVKAHNAEVLAVLDDLKGWVERNHMQPEDYKDRWYVAALEIRNHIEELEKQRYGGKEQGE